MEKPLEERGLLKRKTLKRGILKGGASVNGCEQNFNTLPPGGTKGEKDMKYVKESAILFGITLVGELMNLLLPLPVPAGVYGLLLLLVLVCSGILKLDQVEATGNFLLEIMPILFIPAAVGLMESVDAMRAILVPMLVVCTVSTIIVMIATGKVTELILAFGEKEVHEYDEHHKKDKNNSNRSTGTNKNKGGR